jgi:transcriptional regulator with XRE-family HTH domain
MNDPGDQIARTIRERREEIGMSLNELARTSGVSKGYLWKLEQGEGTSRPSGRSLYKIAGALDTSMSQLLGREVMVDSPQEIPNSLKAFAKEHSLGDREVNMLASIRYRGRQPEKKEDWAFLWDAIQRSVPKRSGR